MRCHPEGRRGLQAATFPAARDRRTTEPSTRPGTLFAVSAIFLFGVFATSARGQSYKFTTIDDPNAYQSSTAVSGTQAAGINASGTIVGFYYDQNEAAHGFILAGDNFTTIDFPGAGNYRGAGTEPNAINDSGKIVGNYQDSNGFNHGFALAGGTFTQIDFPNAEETWANGIDRAGDITGYYIDANYASHGYVLKSGAFNSINYPSAS